MPVSPTAPTAPAAATADLCRDAATKDTAGGNFRLQSNSPCINAGNNLYVTNSVDLDGRPRIVGGTVDLGAYEFRGNGSSEFLAWLQQYQLPTDGTADDADSDDDGLSNWQEWLAGTNPTNRLSALVLFPPLAGPLGVTISWSSVTNRSYFVQRSGNLSVVTPFVTLAPNVAGQDAVTTYNDSTAIGRGPWFYRVGVNAGSAGRWPSFSVISFAWLQQFGLPTDGSADFLDSDGDGLNNWQEWKARTDPTSPQSLLTMLTPGSTNNASGVSVSWQSANGLTYYLQKALSAQGPFLTIRTQTGAAGITTFKDTSATGPGPYFYRVLLIP